MVYLPCRVSRSLYTSTFGHVPHGENGVDLVELIAFEAQLFSHARNIGIVEICAIEVTFMDC
jgi:hypothetical protein